MTGTSIDAVDAALVVCEGRGLAMRATFVDGLTWSLGNLGPRLRAVANQAPHSAAQIAALALESGELHARIVEKLWTRRMPACHEWRRGVASSEGRSPDTPDVETFLSAGRPDLVAAHGQTVFHGPPASWQLFNPWPVARALGAPVVFDLRGADLAAGGQGAPITPLVDWLVLRDVRGRETVCVVNLGGFCNISLLPAGGGPEEVRGLDVCVCNQLLDTIAREHLGVDYDHGGASALAAAPCEEATRELRAQLTPRAGAARSLGTGDERTTWLAAWRDRLAGAVLARSAADAIGGVIGGVCRSRGASRVLVAGGGMHHAALVRAIGEAMGGPVGRTDELGVPGSYREAMAMAVLGALCQDRVPITLSGVTGCAEPAPVGGSWVLP